MKRHSIVVRLSPADKDRVQIHESDSKESTLRFVDGYQRIKFGIGDMLDQLGKRNMYPGEVAIDLAILAATITAADTMIIRAENAQDSWTREIDLYIPVSEPDLWQDNADLIECLLQFLTGDIWRVIFRPRHKEVKKFSGDKRNSKPHAFDSACLFSGGLDSFVGAIDLLDEGKEPILVSHYRDVSTSKQSVCAKALSSTYKDTLSRHVSANVSFNKNDLPGLGGETTMRGRSFIFFALACLAADALPSTTPIYVPENGLISLNVPLNPLRIGTWSTRTTHPYYMARWHDLVNGLGIKAKFINPYRFSTKGEMLAGCKNSGLLKSHVNITISCSSVTKSRWSGHSPRHCGYCAPCLIRRASIEAAFGNDPTKYLIPDLTAHCFDPKKAEARDIRAFQMMGQRLSENPKIFDILVHKPGPLTDYSIDEIKQYAGVFLRGISEVGRLVNGVRIRTP